MSSFAIDSRDVEMVLCFDLCPADRALGLFFDNLAFSTQHSALKHSTFNPEPAKQRTQPVEKGGWASGVIQG
jgi:hypothetical protein